LTMGYRGAPYWVWTVVLSAAAFGLGCPMACIGLYVAISLVFIIAPVRAQTFSRAILGIMKALKLMPKISETERVALEAGKVWVEKDLFSGRPNFKKLMKETSYPELTE